MKNYFYLSLLLLTISLHSMDNNKKRKLDKITSEEFDAKRVKKEKLKQEIEQDLQRIYNHYMGTWTFLHKYKIKKRNITKPIHTAVKKNDNNKIQEIILQKPKHINAKDDDGNAPINLAVNNNNVELTKFLLEHKADVNTTGGKYDEPPLCIALENNNNAMIELLINHNANVNTSGYGGPAPLAIAASEGNIQAVKLIQAATLIAEQEHGEHSGRSTTLQDALRRAIYHKDRNIIDYLIEQEAKITDEIIIAAVNTGNIEITQYLLNKSNKKISEVKNLYGETPLKKAIFNRSIEMVKFLINEKVDINSSLDSMIENERFGNPYISHTERIKRKQETYIIIYFLLKAGALYTKTPHPNIAAIFEPYENLEIKHLQSAISSIKNIDTPMPKELTNKLKKQWAKFDQYILQLAQENNYSELEKVVKESMEDKQ